VFKRKNFLQYHRLVIHYLNLADEETERIYAKKMMKDMDEIPIEELLNNLLYT
jgi:hypothetical protein